MTWSDVIVPVHHRGEESQWRSEQRPIRESVSDMSAVEGLMEKPLALESAACTPLALCLLLLIFTAPLFSLHSHTRKVFQEISTTIVTQ